MGSDKKVCKFYVSNSFLGLSFNKYKFQFLTPSCFTITRFLIFDFDYFDNSIYIYINCHRSFGVGNYDKVELLLLRVSCVGLLVAFVAFARCRFRPQCLAGTSGGVGQ